MKTLTFHSGTDKLVRTMRELSFAHDLETIMEIVRSAARSLTGADGATFVLRDGEYCHYADEDAISPLWKGSRFPMNSCISGWAMLHNQSAVIEDIYADDRIPADVYRQTFVKSMAMVPIRAVTPVGAIGSYWANYHTPSAEEMVLLEALADITGMSLENMNFRTELEQRARECTTNLAEVSRELEVFLFSVSHDLRAPLRALSGYSAILQEEHANKLGTDGQQVVSVIKENTERISKLIDDLVGFSKIGTRQLIRTRIPMESMVREVIGEIPAELKSRTQISLRILPDVYGDAELLRTVWGVLISNAIKYSAKKNLPVVEIGSYRTEGKIVFYVRDNGVGFDMAYTDRLFGVFQRLHNNNEFDGDGVGLSLVKRIIHKHGGSVSGEGKIGGGATFSFTLPDTRKNS
jgi:signal transduction histidine kinase